jgi:hypothetical protein
VGRRSKRFEHSKALGRDDRLRKAELAGYGLPFDDDGEEIWGRLDCPARWTLTVGSGFFTAELRSQPSGEGPDVALEHAMDVVPGDRG